MSVLAQASLAPAPVSESTHARWRTDTKEHAVFTIEGMRCAGCSRSIERALRALVGIERVTINVTTARADVEWDPRRLSLSLILDAVRGAGFRPVPLAGKAATALQRAERRSALKRIGLAGLGMMQTMMFVYGLYSGGAHGIEPSIAKYLRFAGMIFATPVLLYSGAPFFVGAVRDVRRRSLGMDVPVALALGLAYGASVINTFRGTGEVYFDSVTMFIFFLLTGRFLELTVRQRSLNATEALARSLPATAARIRSDGTVERIVVQAVEPGDRLSVAKGGVIPVDASLTVDRALVDESLITGESEPVAKRAGDRLLSGSINAGHAIELVAGARASDSTLANIVRLLERVQAERPRIARITDRVASYFVSVTLALAVLVTVAWLFVDSSRAFTAALAVLVVTCPCALSLATPVVIAAATARIARLGLLVARPDALERLARVDTVVIDKTGTLTRGTPTAHVSRARIDYSPERVLAIAAALERASDHPLAAAFVEFADPAVIARDAGEFAGRGVEGRIEGRLWRLGREDFVAEILPREAGGSVAGSFGALVLGNTEGVVARLEVRDVVRPDAVQAIQEFRGHGIRVIVASGDRDVEVRNIAGQVGITESLGQLSPEQKLAFVQELQRQGRRTLMVGDGINDGPVLAAADVSCAMGRGSAIAHAAADLLLLNDSLLALPQGIYVARRAMRTVRQNLGWAFLYNVAAVPLAALGWVPPWVAAIGMSTSSLAVVLNAARLARAGVAAEGSARPMPSWAAQRSAVAHPEGSR